MKKLFTEKLSAFAKRLLIFFGLMVIMPEPVHVLLVFLPKIINAIVYDFHVCNTAQGTGDGSSQANCGTMALANAAIAGQAVGFYDDTGDFLRFLVPAYSGTSNANRILFQAAAGEFPVIWNGQLLDGPWTKIGSGTDANHNAMYEQPDDTVTVAQQTVYENDPGKTPFESSGSFVKASTFGFVGTEIKGAEVQY